MINLYGASHQQQWWSNWYVMGLSITRSAVQVSLRTGISFFLKLYVEGAPMFNMYVCMYVTISLQPITGNEVSYQGLHDWNNMQGGFDKFVYIPVFKDIIFYVKTHWIIHWGSWNQILFSLSPFTPFLMSITLGISCHRQAILFVHVKWTLNHSAHAHHLVVHNKQLSCISEMQDTTIISPRLLCSQYFIL